MSSSTPEGKVKEKVTKLLKQYEGLYYYMPVTNGMGKRSLDYIGCYRGFFFAIETKADGKALTPKQVSTKEEMEKAGGRVFTVIGDEGMIELGFWLSRIKTLYTD